MKTHGVQIVAFTRQGVQLASEASKFLENSVIHAPSRYCAPDHQPLDCPVGEWAKRHFHSSNALLFVGAAGIAVRAIAPLLKGKADDPAVLCLDENGAFVIPLLSGHIGGANDLAKRLADALGATAVITTATDARNVFAVDHWAVNNRCAIPFLWQIKRISAALLDRLPVGLVSDFPIVGELPVGVELGTATKHGIYLSVYEGRPFSQTLWLAPKCLCLGIGCRRGVPFEALEQEVLYFLEKSRLSMAAVNAIATIDRKGDEEAILTFAEKYNLPLRLYSAQQLREVPGSFHSSSFVLQTTGVDNVSERAACMGGGRLLVPKYTCNGISLAVAIQEWRAVFCSC